MQYDRLLIEDILSSYERMLLIHKLEVFAENIRYTTAEFVFDYIVKHLESGQSLDTLSVRSMIEELLKPDLSVRELLKRFQKDSKIDVNYEEDSL